MPPRSIMPGIIGLPPDPRASGPNHGHQLRSV
jgi:hypothetical protein